MARANPDLSDKEIIDKTRVWTADPVDRPSGHQAGAAVDLTILQNGEEVDMGGKFSEFNDKTRTKCEGLLENQIRNRQWLQGVMETTGLLNYNEEW